MLTAQLSGAPLGNILDDVTMVLQQGQQYIDVIKLVLEDPALPRVAQQVRILASLPSGPSAPTKPGQAPAPKKKGVGLQVAVAPIDAYIWSRQHKGATIAMGIAALLAPIGAGVLIGRLTKRCKVAVAGR